MPSPHFFVIPACHPAPSTLSDLAPYQSCFPKPLYAMLSEPESGTPQPIAQSSAFALGATLVSRPCSFCRVTSRTFGLTPKACAASHVIWLAGLTTPFTSGAE